MGNSMRKEEISVRQTSLGLVMGLVLSLTVCSLGVASSTEEKKDDSGHGQGHDHKSHSHDHDQSDSSETNLDVKDLDISRTRGSEWGRFTATISPEKDPIPINQIQSWVLDLKDKHDMPVKQAEITVEGGMPEHGHGLPTSPKVTENFGDGRYLVEGIKFQMPGVWEVVFNIHADGHKDVVVFYLKL
ncbi:MAG TPA: FixH family protein [Arenicellales bacterium]|jgi:hypothetical protein|nr:hypothetical protein [Nitrospinota bacterium]MBP10050.1 hypothetical protein [Acidiferrobacteraceae bacterium]HJP09561.1 FixH family protein [Arenicellales bacterium]